MTPWIRWCRPFFNEPHEADFQSMSGSRTFLASMGVPQIIQKWTIWVLNAMILGSWIIMVHFSTAPGIQRFRKETSRMGIGRYNTWGAHFILPLWCCKLGPDLGSQQTKQSSKITCPYETPPNGDFHQWGYPKMGVSLFQETPKRKHGGCREFPHWEPAIWMGVWLLRTKRNQWEEVGDAWHHQEQGPIHTLRCNHPSISLNLFLGILSVSCVLDCCSNRTTFGAWILSLCYCPPLLQQRITNQ